VSEHRSTSLDWPDVDVVMPVRNEADHLATAVAAVHSQEYPGTVRIFLGVGPSDDGTEQIAADLAAGRADVLVVANPSGTTPAALNAAIRAGTAPVVVRVDGHSELSAGYIRRAVETMLQTGAANVGGLQVPVPTTPFEQAVATATTSWLGTGGASYRVGGLAGPTDTVFLGVFDRVAIESVGLFDERLIRNQDYELNIRLRKSGGLVWFDPGLEVGYRPRTRWRDLARQYYEYGLWKAAVVRLHPGMTRRRQVLPVVGFSTVVAASVLAARERWLVLVPSAYFAAVVSAAYHVDRRRAPRVAFVLTTIHAAWTAGAWVGMSRGVLGRSLTDAPDRTEANAEQATKRSVAP
jgi:succinoglycan biosynthesis protein ExoA